MPKEFQDIKASLKKAHPSWAAEKVEEMASATFSKIFGTNPQHAHKLEESGGWVAYKDKRKHEYAREPDHESSKEMSFEEEIEKEKKEHPSFSLEQVKQIVLDHRKEKKECVVEEFVPGFAFKEVDGEYYVEGFLSDPTVDLGKDIVEDQQRLVEQINHGDAISGKLSFRHDWLKLKDPHGEASPTPFGSMVGKAELRKNPLSGNMAAYAKFKLNKKYPNFEDKKYEIEQGHVGGFSIEYDPLPGGTEDVIIGGVKVRKLNNYRYLGTGVAARPMHPNAVITGFYAKEYEMLDDFAGKGDPTLPPGHSNFGSYDPNSSTAAKIYGELEQFKLDHEAQFHKLKISYPDYSDNQIMAMVKRSHELVESSTKLTADAAQRQHGGMSMSKEEELQAQLDASVKELTETKAKLAKKDEEEKEEKKMTKEVIESLASLKAQFKEAQARSGSGSVLNPEGANGESAGMKESEKFATKMGEFKEMQSKVHLSALDLGAQNGKELFSRAEELVRMNGGIFKI